MGIYVNTANNDSVDFDEMRSNVKQKENVMNNDKTQCEACAGTGWYGDNGPGIPGNSEIARCDCGANAKCTYPWHEYRILGGIPWCDECGLEADLSDCKLTHHTLTRNKVAKK